MSFQKKHQFLIGMIQDLGPSWIKTRWLFVDLKSGDLRDVTAELCDGITQYNEKQVVADKRYAQIPYEYHSKLARYRFGCGLSHYLQPDAYAELAETGILSFPIEGVRMLMLTPSDLKSLLKVEDVFDPMALTKTYLYLEQCYG